MAVTLLAVINAHALQFCIATVSKAGAPSKSEAVRSMSIQAQPKEQGTNFVVICTVIIATSVKKSGKYLYGSQE